MNSVQEYSMNFNSRLKVNFKGGDLTSDAGLLLYKEFDHRLRLAETVQEMLVVHDPAHHRDHPNSDVVLQKLYQHLAGYHIERRDQFVMDLDSSGFAAYGQQRGANYNHHYKQTGFHPLFCFDGLTGDCLGTELRAGNVYTSRQAVRFMGPILTRYESYAPDA